MEIELTSEQSDVLRHAIETGRVHDMEQAGREAMALWVEREHRRIELLDSLDSAEASLARGDGIVLTENLTSEVMARLRARIDADASERR